MLDILIRPFSRKKTDSAKINIDPEVIRDFRIMISYLYQFANHVDWPAAQSPSKDGVFKLCILGDALFKSFLSSKIHEFNKHAEGLKMQLVELSAVNNFMDCHMLYIGSAENQALPGEILPRLINTAVLSISDAKHFAMRGGAIEFVRVKKAAADEQTTKRGANLRYVLNSHAVTSKNLKVSSELVKLSVKAERPGGRVYH